MLKQVAEFSKAVDANQWIQDNKIDVIEFQYVGNRHYGTSILVVYKQDFRQRV